MSTLSPADKRCLEEVLAMGGGYVLDFTNRTFSDFFAYYGVDIDAERYMRDGPSKARRLRVFWELEEDRVVGLTLDEMLKIYDEMCSRSVRELDADLLERSKRIVRRLSGGSLSSGSMTSEDFLNEEFQIPDLDKLPVEPLVAQIVRDRVNEAQTCLKVGAHLSTILLCGSALEGVLLGAAQRDPERFNRAASSPKNAQGKVKRLHEWSLSELINVAEDVGLLDPDVRKFGHGLRDFRNYIHPYLQMASGFAPDEHTAKVCFQVLKAALADVSGERRRITKAG